MTEGIFAANACKYGHLNWLIFPLAPGSKVPMKGTAGLKEASASRAQITAWCKQFPDANIGMACGPESGVIVIDIDPRNGGTETVARLAHERKALPETVESATPSGGRHLFYAYDPRVTVSGTNKLGKGIDISTNCHYVVLPPSYWSKVGKSYRWVRPPRGVELTPLPRWIIAALAPRPRPEFGRARLPSLNQASGYRRQAIAELHELAGHMANLGDGRHQAPFVMACRIGKYQRHGFLTEAEIEQAFLDASTSNGALSKYAPKDLLSQTRNGLRRAAHDALPPLMHVHRKGAAGRD